MGKQGRVRAVQPPRRAYTTVTRLRAKLGQGFGLRPIECTWIQLRSGAQLTLHPIMRQEKIISLLCRDTEMSVDVSYKRFLYGSKAHLCLEPFVIPYVRMCLRVV